VNNLKSIPETLRELFGNDVLANCDALRLKANAYVLNKDPLIQSDNIAGNHNDSHFIEASQATILYNALLIDTIVVKPAQVKEVFRDKKKRAEIAELAEAILIGKQTVTGIALCSTNVADFLSGLKGDLNLYEERLANPYKKFPNQIFGSHTGIVRVLLAQSQLLSAGDSVLVHFLNGDIAKANEMAAMLPAEGDTGLLRQMIQRQYQQASEFDDLLDFFKKV
jgi:hypothetical protein